MISTTFEEKLETKLERMKILALLTIQNIVMVKLPAESGGHWNSPSLPLCYSDQEKVIKPHFPHKFSALACY